MARRLRERPLQIYLRPDQDKALRQIAEREKVALAELVRRGVDRLLVDMPIENDPAMKLIGLGRSGKRNLARDHDRYLIRYATNYRRRKKKR